MSRMPEVQTMIDECADGTWQAVLYVGSNFICRLHADTFLHAAAELDKRIADERSLWGRNEA